MKINESLILWEKFKAQTAKDEAEALYVAIILTPPGDIVEIGSARGGTTIVLIGAGEEVGKHVYSIDPYPEELENVAAHYTPGVTSSPSFRSGRMSHGSV